MGILSVSFDLDEIRCYHDIHGLEPPEGSKGRVIYERALPRIASFCDELGIKSTLFVIGDDIELNERVGDDLKSLADNGHEIGNHTMTHPYNLTLLDEQAQKREISEASEVIESAVGVRPRGFRAPGYNVHLGLLDIVSTQGYAYDSSVFPCPSYYSAKAGAMGIKQLLGKKSRAVMGDPRILLAPTEPYRLGRDGAWTKGEGMIELPISTVTGMRLPFIGTALTMAGKTASKTFAKMASKHRFVNLELHGIDLVDAEGDGVTHLLKYQPDLKKSLISKRETLKSVVKYLLDSGMQPMPLIAASERLFV